MTVAPAPAGRLSTGVAGLDAMVGGGFLPGDATLVAGSPGTGKTTLGLHFLAAGVQAGEPGVFVTFEYLGGEMQKACNVLKFRGGAHDRRYRLLEMTDHGIVIQSAFAGVENISGGAARRSIQQRAQELV
ncbi:MAG: hypothetical protein LC623_01380 [Halobacteriales archaeon]|nr:hypothetical protein [Halobacteriales archaeon]